MNRSTSAILVLASIASMQLLAQSPSSYEITAEVPLNSGKVVGLHETTSRGLAVGLSLGSNSDVVVYEREGRRRWSTKIDSKLVGLEAGRGRLLAITVQSQTAQETGNLRAHILDAESGSVLRRFEAPHGSEIGISKLGDAVITYPNPMEDPGKTLRIRQIDGGANRTILVDTIIGAAVAIDYDRVLILTENGRLDYFHHHERLWSRPIKLVDSATNLQVAAEAGVALVGLPRGAYVAIALANGAERFRYSPFPPERALASLKLLDDAKRLLSGPDQKQRLARLAANFKATLLPNGEVIFESTVEDPTFAARVRPLIGQTERMTRLADIRKLLEGRGMANALRQNPRARGGVRQFTFLSDSTGAAVVEGGSLFIFKR